MTGVQGKWNVTLQTPVGERAGVLELRVTGTRLTGTLSGGEHHAVITDGRVEGNRLRWSAAIETPMRLTFKFTAVVDADRISGSARHLLGSATFTGVRSP
jgi:hypothetical protein